MCLFFTQSFEKEVSVRPLNKTCDNTRQDCTSRCCGAWWLGLFSEHEVDEIGGWLVGLRVDPIRMKPETERWSALMPPRDWKCKSRESRFTPCWPWLQTHSLGDGASKASHTEGERESERVTWKQQGSAARPNRWITYQRRAQQTDYEAATLRQLGHYQFTFN